MPARRALVLLPWALCLIGAGFGGWQRIERGVAAHRADSLVAVVDSMGELLDEASVTEFQLERKRAASEKMLNDLTAGREDLQRMYEKEKAASDEAIAAEADAMRQTMAKETALEGERTARSEERQQRRLAEARADSINEQQQISTRANLRLQASKVAQNSMALKGDQRLRGLMAVYASHAMERAGGDVNKEEILRALQGALDELERSSPPGANMLSAGPRAMVMKGAELRVLGSDCIITGIDPVGWKKHTIVDLSRYCGKTGGRAFISEGLVLTANMDRGVALCSAADGSLIAKEDRTPHTEDIISMAAFPGGQGLVSGDRDGRIVVWAVDGGGMRVLKEHAVGGNVRAMVADAGSGTVVAVNGTERIFIITGDGSMATVSLSDADRAHSLANGISGEVLVGSHQGSVYALRPEGRDLRRLHTGSGQRVEAIAAETGAGRLVAFADAVRGFTVFDRKESGGSAFRLSLTGIPSVLAFGNATVAYIGYEDRSIRRVYTDSGTMADRVCALVGRPWTAEEWAHHIGEGQPGSACSATP